MHYLNIHLIMINFNFLYKFILQFISYIDYSSYILSIFKIFYLYQAYLTHLFFMIFTFISLKLILYIDLQFFKITFFYSYF